MNQRSLFMLHLKGLTAVKRSIVGAEEDFMMKLDDPPSG